MGPFALQRIEGSLRNPALSDDELRSNRLPSSGANPHYLYFSDIAQLEYAYSELGKTGYTLSMGMVCRSSLSFALREL